MTKPDIQSARDFAGNHPIPLNGTCLLAEGDSWFTIGRLLPARVPNLLASLEMSATTTIINCAYPGDTLRHIGDAQANDEFDRQLRDPRFALPWRGILLSGGGNDLIDAAQHLAVNADGSPAGLDERVLLTPAEAAAVNPGEASAARFVSGAGWQRLADYIVEAVRQIVAMRDAGMNRDKPIIMHTYSTPTVWRCGAGTASDGWLFKAFRDYGIPAREQQALAVVLFNRLRSLLLALASDSGRPQAQPGLHVFDSAGAVTLEPPDPAARASSGDWSNEIHPNSSGYAKIGRAFGPFIENVLATSP